MAKWLFLAGAIVTEVSGSLALKAAITAPLWYIVVAVGYIAAFVFLNLALRRRMPLGVAYGIWGAIGVALTAGLSALIFGEALGLLSWVGMALVIVGVLVVELGSQAAQRAKSAA